MNATFIIQKPHQLLLIRLITIEKSFLVAQNMITKSVSHFQTHFKTTILKSTDQNSKSESVQSLIFSQIYAKQNKIESLNNSIRQIFDSFIYPIPENLKIILEIFLFIFENLNDFKSELTKLFLEIFSENYEFLKNVPNFDNLFFQIFRNVNFWLKNPFQSEHAIFLFELINSKFDFMLADFPAALLSVITNQTLKALIFSDEKAHLTSLKKTCLLIISKFINLQPSSFFVGGRESYMLIFELQKKSEFEQLFQSINLSELLSIKLSQKTHVLVISSNIPSTVEKFLLFLLSSAHRSSFNQQLNWLLKLSLISSGSESESNLIDLIRYVLICTRDVHASENTGNIRRWLVLGWLFNEIKSEKCRQLAKNGLFIDWVCDLKYEEEEKFEEENKTHFSEDNFEDLESQNFVRNNISRYSILNTTWELILNSLKNYSALSNELFDHAFYLNEYSGVGNNFSENLKFIKSQNRTFFEQLKNGKCFNKNLMDKFYEKTKKSINEDFLFLPKIGLKKIKREVIVEYDDFDLKAKELLEKMEIINKNVNIFQKKSLEKNENYSQNELNKFEFSDNEENYEDFQRVENYSIEFTEIATVFCSIGPLAMSDKISTAQFPEKQHLNLCNKILEILKIENMLEKASNYCENGYFIFKRFNATLESQNFSQALLKKSIVYFSENLLFYSFFENALVYFLSVYEKAGMEVLVNLFQINHLFSPKFTDFQEILTRVFNQLSNSEKIAVNLFKWAFIRVNEKEFTDFFIFVSDFFNNLNSQKTRIAFNEIFLKAFDDRKFGMLVDPSKNKIVRSKINENLREILKITSDPNIVLNAISHLIACFFIEIKFNSNLYEMIFLKLTEFTIIGNIFKQEMKKLAFFSVRFFDEVN